jgi:hypothetical protein
VSRFAVAALLCAGCSLTFDGSAPDLPLLGAEPATAQLPRLNHVPTPSIARLMFSDDGVPWATFTEIQPDGVTKGLRLVRLSPPAAEQLVTEPEFFTTADSFYIFHRDPDGTTNPMTHLQILDVGAATPAHTFDFPGGPNLIIVDAYDLRFLYFVESADTTTYQIFRRDGSYVRTLPVPDAVDPTNPTASAMFIFNLDGSLLFVRDGNGRFTIWQTDGLRSWDLGIRPPSIIADPYDQMFASCGDDGLREFSRNGLPDRVLDTTCDPKGAFFPRFDANGTLLVVYTAGDGVTYSVPFDGGGPRMQVLPVGQRVMGFGPAGDVMYTTVPDDMFVNGAGDAWIGGWRFMERGLDAGWSRDGKRVRWLEHAAQPSGVGELFAAPTPGGAAVHLARNVRQFDELDDGRLLADANHAFRGTQNRVVVIDEKKLTQTWVASAAHEYEMIPGTNDIMVDVVTGPSTYDIVRVPIPPK